MRALGALPEALELGGRDYAIRTDYRVVLNIFQAFEDPDLPDRLKWHVCLKCLFRNDIPRELTEQAMEQAKWFLNGGDTPKSELAEGVRAFDWEQDEGLIFPEINKVAGCEVRALKSLHWWTFLGYFGTIDEGVLTEIMHIRVKQAKGKPLDKTEREFLREHRSLVVLNKRMTAAERAAEEADEAFLRELLGE